MVMFDFDKDIVPLIQSPKGKERHQTLRLPIHIYFLRIHLSVHPSITPLNEHIWLAELVVVDNRGSLDKYEFMLHTVVPDIELPYLDFAKYRINVDQ